MAASSSSVRIRREPVVFPTYEPLPPEKNPMFLEKRVYQGSRGSVYPLPFTDRISETKTNRTWDAVYIENEYLSLMILPEIGGRIHVGQDKTNGYDFFYRQNVIKPALVGLAGSWISGGVEFNWPQHHRPGTFMPADVHIEEHADGSKTIWLSEHDPMNRLKGMHGVCLHPGKAIIELKARLYNRTPFVQSFLWWANVATRVHEHYQSFFPPDVYYIADHAKRAMSEYPLCQDHYYGLDYGSRGKNGVPESEMPSDFIPQKSGLDYAANDLSWYANIPVPTSYMCMGTKEDFFGGYDHAKQAGVVHFANHHISPGKKQWTWGNHEFGYAWDRNLTDEDGPYIELMAGVYTDNQPDFSFLQPGETKTFSQYWYPIQKIGPAQHANKDVALSLLAAKGKVRAGVSVSMSFPGATVRLENTKTGKLLGEWKGDLLPGAPLVEELGLSAKVEIISLKLSVWNTTGEQVISYAPVKREKGEVPPPATEPLAPQDVQSADELYLTGLHLEQYRHATRKPDDYWREALRRDPGDARCNNALGLWHLRRGEFTDAETCFRKSIARITNRNPNPYDGEPYYNLGLALRFLGRTDEAYDAFYKAVWNQAWQSAGYHALAEIDASRGDWPTALDHLDRSLRYNTDNLKARDLRAIALRHLGKNDEATQALRATLTLDPLDWWARHLLGESLTCDSQAHLDIALDFARAGLFIEAIALLKSLSNHSAGTAPLVEYTLGWLVQRSGDSKTALSHFKAAEKAAPDYCFPSRLEEIVILNVAMAANPKGARAPYYLGNLFYDKRRHTEAISLWEKSAQIDPTYSVAWRNLGIGYFNISHKAAKARAAYQAAIKANASDGRLVYERDQLWKRLGDSPKKRLRELEKHLDLVAQRDDLSVELCALYNQTGQHPKALAIVSTRKFQPWEGGEGQSLGQHVRTHLALGRAALQVNDAITALVHFEAALSSPVNLGEAKHLLANQSDIHFWIGEAYTVLGAGDAATRHWKLAAEFKGDFQGMSVRAYSEMTYYSALAWQRLGEKAKGDQLLRDLQVYARDLRAEEAKIDYFATSLPTMLLFDDDLNARKETTALFLEAQALLGLGKKARAAKLLAQVLERDPNHAQAADLVGA